MQITLSDIDYMLLTLLVILLTLSSFKKRKIPLPFSFSLDRGLVTVIKGVSCILILMSHHFTLNFVNHAPWTYPMIVGNHASHVALALFVFLSGYGVTMSYNKKQLPFGTYFKARVWKVYKPLLLVCMTCTLMYFLLPSKSIEELITLKLPLDIYYLHHFDVTQSWNILLHTLGCFDWFVYCISFFYIIFWLSACVAKKIRMEHTYILLVFMILYSMIAIPLFGESHAHYYRLPWAFWLGNFVCSKEINKKYAILLLGVVVLTWIPQGVIMMRSYMFAICCIVITFILNRYYVIKSQGTGSLMLLLGTVSYFYYLIHIRLTWTLLKYICLESVTIWAIINFVVAYWAYKLFFWVKK